VLLCLFLSFCCPGTFYGRKGFVDFKIGSIFAFWLLVLVSWSKTTKIGTGATCCPDAKFHTHNKIVYLFQKQISKLEVDSENCFFYVLLFVVGPMI
jgi:hypothetical protein